MARVAAAIQISKTYMIWVLRHDPDPRLRAEAALWLGHRTNNGEYRDIVRALSKALRIEQDDRVRHALIEALDVAVPLVPPRLHTQKLAPKGLAARVQQVGETRLSHIGASIGTLTLRQVGTAIIAFGAFFAGVAFLSNVCTVLIHFVSTGRFP